MLNRATVWNPNARVLAIYDAARSIAAITGTLESGQTVIRIDSFQGFDIAGYLPNRHAIMVFIDGAFKTSGIDYTEVDEFTIQLSSPATGGERATLLVFTEIKDYKQDVEAYVSELQEYARQARSDSKIIADTKATAVALLNYLDATNDQVDAWAGGDENYEGWIRGRLVRSPAKMIKDNEEIIQAQAPSLGQLALPGGAELVGNGVTNVANHLNILQGAISKISFADILDAATTDVNASPFIREISDSRFEIYIPVLIPGRYKVFRFDNSESNFDGAAGFIRPYLLTTIEDRLLSSYSDTPMADGTKVGTWVTSGSSDYSNTTGDTITFSVLGNRLDLRYFSTTNGGIAFVTVDGQKANKLPVDGMGNSFIDTYGSGSTVLLTIADNLSDGPHTVVITVSGEKNVNSTDYRVYINNSIGALRTYLNFSTQTIGPLSIPANLSQTSLGYWKLSNAATTSAMAFRPASMPSAVTPFLGSVHGYENRESLTFFLNGQQTNLMSPQSGRAFSFDSLRIEQSAKCVHPDDIAVDYTLREEVHTFNKTQDYVQTYRLEVLQPITVLNGYSQMFTAQGGLQGGVPGATNGWCNRVTFSGVDTYDVSSGDGSFVGNKLTSEIVFWGTPKQPSEINRADDSGDRITVVSFPDINRSLNYYKNPTALLDSVFVWNRNTDKKLYVQPFRLQGDLPIGWKFSAAMRVKLYVFSDAYKFIQ